MNEIKERITSYWSKRAEDFADQRLRELSSAKRARWETELRRYLPQGRVLRVLDLGTGTGFFAFLFAAGGHNVTGIDLTADMIAEAEKTARYLRLDADFHVMDAEHPEFAPETFDVLVTRNLTWALPRLGDAYKAWYDLLKPGGVLINFDADYCRAEPDDDLPENHAHKRISDAMMQENDAITMELSAHQEARPQWDVQLLTEAGFSRIVVDNAVWKRIYAEKDEFYNPTPIFTVAAYK